jgi:hypothetical protein
MPNNNIVDSTIERPSSRAANSANQTERIDKGLALAAVLQAIPVFIWAAPVVLIFGFILMALWYNREGHALHDFTQGVLLWASRLLIFGGGCLVLAAAWKCYRMYRQFMIDAQNERTARATARKAIAGARNAELKNELLEADILLRKQIPNVILALTRTGVAFEYDAKGNLKVAGPAAQTMVTQMGQEQLGAGGQAAIAGPANLPMAVRYEDVRDRIPEGHSLLGVSSSGVVETCDFGDLMTMWICGGSSTGKSNTVGIKMEEAITNGRNLGIICIDYHARKPDSLYNKIRAYEDRFLMPVAYTEEQALKALQVFLAEFTKRRDVGGGARDILLVVDEVPAVLESEDEEIVRLLKKIARICGRESRGFGMFGWFISQNAVGLAWLRNVVLTVIAHKMNMLNEAILACNQHADIARDMENWPRGRVIVYGLSFQGFKVLQMPLLAQSLHPARSESKGPAGPVVVTPAPAGDDLAADDLEDESDTVDAAGPGQEENGPAPRPALAGDLRKAYDAVQHLISHRQKVEARGVAAITGFGKDKANGLLNQLETLGYIERRKAV